MGRPRKRPKTAEEQRLELLDQIERQRERLEVLRSLVVDFHGDQDSQHPRASGPKGRQKAR